MTRAELAAFPEGSREAIKKWYDDDADVLVEEALSIAIEIAAAAWSRIRVSPPPVLPQARIPSVSPSSHTPQLGLIPAPPSNIVSPSQQTRESYQRPASQASRLPSSRPANWNHSASRHRDCPSLPSVSISLQTSDLDSANVPPSSSPQPRVTRQRSDFCNLQWHFFCEEKWYISRKGVCGHSEKEYCARKAKGEKPGSGSIMRIIPWLKSLAPHTRKKTIQIRDDLNHALKFNTGGLMQDL